MSCAWGGGGYLLHGLDKPVDAINLAFVFFAWEYRSSLSGVSG